MSEYRREYQRFPASDSISLLFSDGQKKSAVMKDISSRGAGLISDFELLVNQQLLVFLNTVLLNSPLTRNAKVVWSSKSDGCLWQSGIDFGLDNKIEF